MSRQRLVLQPKVFGGTAEQLRAFDINIAPPQDLWVLVDKENGIWFKQVRETQRVVCRKLCYELCLVGLCSVCDTR